MEKHSIWLPILLTMMLGVTGCGDSDGGGTGGSGGTGGAGGAGATGGSNGSEFCSAVCTSPCAGDLGTTGDAQQCIDDCDGAGIFEGCESETVAFIECLEDNDCGTSGAANCVNQTLAFAQCFGAIQ
ncbi:MAG: hypothetical protein E4H00_04650 [Myxococcales bacterium]|nr:MAG: hypothetical protein E4H00_04650 [Myxococcales bacterium]